MMSLASHFGVSASAGLPAPEDDAGYRWVSPIGAGVRMVGTSLIETRLSLSAREIAFVMRLDEPISVQMKRIKRMVEGVINAEVSGGRISARPDFRSRIDHYPLYIRALDLESTGKSPSDISKIMFPNEENSIHNNFSTSKKVSNYVKAAKSLRDGGYRYFAYLD